MLSQLFTTTPSIVDAIDNLYRPLELLFFAHAFASHQQHSVRQLHPEWRIRQRKDGRGVDDNPIEKCFELFEQLLEPARLHELNWILRRHASGKEPEASALELVDDFRQLALSTKNLAESRQVTTKTETASQLRPPQIAIDQHGIENLASRLIEGQVRGDQTLPFLGMLLVITMRLSLRRSRRCRSFNPSTRNFSAAMPP